MNSPSPSPSASPAPSPRTKALWKLNGISPTTVPHSRPTSSSPSVTYIPPLIDGACGTTPNTRRPFAQQLQHEISQAARLLPTLIVGAAVARASIFEAAQHVALALLECCILALTIPLWLVLPGVFFAIWLGCCSALILAVSSSLNGGRRARGQIIQTPSPSADGWMMGQENDDEQWFFVGGLGIR